MAVSDLCYIDDSGFHVSDYPTILEYLKQEYRTIYGNDVYLEPDSQDGQWIAVQAMAIVDLMNIAAGVYNSFSPLTATGDALSRVVKINGINRRESTYSTVDLLLIGQTGTVINNGQAEDSKNQVWILPTSVTIPLGGEVTVTATAQEPGGISAAAGTITTIKTPTLGWQSVNNALAATEGVNIESDGELRLRQSISVAIPSLSVFEGILGAVADLDGITKIKGYENDQDAPDINGIPAHSISLIVEGGDVQEIGDTIAFKKTPGTGTYGTTNVTTYDRYGVSNVINFYRPTTVDIDVQVNINALAGYSSTYADDIKAAVSEFINSNEIGDDILISKLFTPANLTPTSGGDTFDITSIQIARDGGLLGSSNITLTFNEVAECLITSVEVIVT